MLLPNNLVMAEVMATQITTFRLCLKIATKFTKEKEHKKAFNSCVARLLGKIKKQTGLISVSKNVVWS